MTKLFPKTYLVNELDLPWSAVEDIIADVSRWSVHHTIVFQDGDGKYYKTNYSVGATECQDERPWDYQDTVECIEVEQRQVTVMRWVPVE